MFNRVYPSLKVRAQLKESVDLSKFNGNKERYVIHMHRKSFWTNKWMQEPGKNFCRLQVQHYDPSAQYRRGWRSMRMHPTPNPSYDLDPSKYKVQTCEKNLSISSFLSLSSSPSVCSVISNVVS
jgi:hypothetical protein